MGRVCTDGDMDGDRGGIAIGLAQQAEVNETRVGDGFEMLPERFAKTLLVIQCRVKLTAGFFSGSEAAVREHGFHVFAGLSGDGDFEIVNRGRAVERKGSGVTALHKIDQDGREAALDDMAAESPEDHFLAGAGVD